MKILRLLFPALFFLSALQVTADTDSTWSLTLKNSASQDAQSVRQTSDHGFIIGITARVKTLPKPGSKLVVVKTTFSGRVLWEKTYGSGIFVDVRQLKSGKYAAVGYRFVKVGTGFDTSMVILVLSADGSVEWQQVSPRGFYPSGIEEGPDESLFVYGNSTAYNGSAFLIKLRSNGEMVWQKQFSEGAAPATFEIADDGNAFFGFAGGLHEYHVYKLNLDGKIFWKRFYKTSIFAASTFQSLELTPDGGFIIAEQLPLVSKYDKNGEPQWIKFYSTTTMATVYSLVSDKKGNILLAGQIGTVRGHPDLWLLKIDKLGNILWHKRLGRNFVDRAWSVSITKDDHFIIAGEIGRGKFTGSSAWLLKINQRGVFGNPCNFAINNVAAQLEHPQMTLLPTVKELQKANIQIQFVSASEEDWSTISDYSCK